MATIRVVYRLSEKGRKAALLVGLDSCELQIHKVPATPELIEIAEVRTDGTAWIWVTDHVNPHERYLINNGDSAHGPLRVPSIYATSRAQQYVDSIEIDEAPRDYQIDDPVISPVDIVARALAAREASHAAAVVERDALRAESARKLAEKVASTRAAVAEWMASGAYSWTIDASALSAEERAPVEEEIRRRRVAAEARAAASMAAQDAAVAAAKAKTEAEALAWIASHGSDRLKGIVTAGLLPVSLGVYRDERLALEYPRAFFDSEAIRESEIINPSAAAVAALLKMRETNESANLLKVRGPDDPRWSEAIKFDPGEWSDWGAFRIVTAE